MQLKRTLTVAAFGMLILPWTAESATDSGQARAAAPIADPLERPSAISPRAQTALLTSVARAGSRLVAAGDRGTVLVSDDDAKSWSQRATPVSVLLTGVRFADAKRGWVIGHGGVILTTADGGDTWTRVMDGHRLAALVLESAKAQAAKSGAAGSGAADESTRRARELAAAERFAKEGADKPLLALYFDPDIGLLAAGAFGVVLQSKNGLDGWTSWQDRVPNAKGVHLYAIVRSGDSLYLAGEQGNVFRSTDQGQTFKEVNSPYNGSFFGGLASAKQDLLVFGLRGNAYHFSADTQTWNQVQLPTQNSVNHGIRLRNGGALLFTQGGEALYSPSGVNEFKAETLPKPVPIVGATQASGDGVVLVGLRGPLLARFKIATP